MKKVCTLLLFAVSLLIHAQTTPGKHSIKISNVNTKQADFGVNFMGANKVIFASPNDKVTIVRRVWRENGQPYLDLYIGDIDSLGNIVNKRKLEGEVNKRLHEASVAFTKDLKTVYFSANNYNEKEKSIRGKEGFDYIQLYKANVNGEGEWSNIEKLPFNSNDFNTGLPSLSKDDTKLYFASDRPGGLGKTDLYVADVTSNGFSEPKNLGPRINTEEREMFPFIADDNILYFSSNGHPGYGNLDVFASKVFDNTVSEALNLEQPINSPRDDFAYILKNEEKKGFFSSNRGNGKGDDDIYSFLEDDELFIECLQEIKGAVRDKDTKELIPGAIVQVLDADGNQLQITAAKEDDASFSFLIPCNTDITLVGSNDGYLKEERSLKTLNDLDTEPIVENLDMTPEFIMAGDELLININVIYFDFDKSNIREDAATELDKVVEVMQKYPELDIFATSHTDERGRPRYNMRLSDRRAKSTVDYILSKGIDAERIKSEGKGETEPAVDCMGKKCTEEEHQLNRRTNFKVVEQIRVRRDTNE